MARRARMVDGSPVLLFVGQPTGQVPELDILAYEFFFESRDEGELTKLSFEMIGSIIVDPSTLNLQNHNLKMRLIGGEGGLVPAHFPSISDTYPFRIEFKYFLRWCFGAYPFTNPAQPHCLLPAMAVVDPRPELMLDSEPFYLDMLPVRIHMASYADAFQLISSPSFPSALNLSVSYAHETPCRPGHHAVDLDSLFLLPQSTNVPVPIDCKIVIWNVRDLARESARLHFTQIFQRFRPEILVLTETRQTTDNVIEILTGLPGEYQFVHCPGVGLCGGVLVVWLGGVISVVRLYAPLVRLKLNIQGHRPSRRRLF